MNTKLYGFLVNISLGISWALLVIGAGLAFLYYHQYGFFVGVLAAIVGIIPGLLLITIFEFFISHNKQSLELKKQTELLGAILSELRSGSS